MTKIEIKKDCFAYKNGECEALNDLYCKNEKCNFYKVTEYQQITLGKENENGRK